MKIMYIHGLGSGKDSRTAKVLREHLSNDDIYAPEIPINPKEAMRFVYAKYKEYSPDIVVGSSLGGFYTMQLGGCKKILINPAMFADKDIVSAIGYGTHKYLVDRDNGDVYYKIDAKFIYSLKKMRDTFFNYSIDEGNLFETYGLFARDDELFHHYDDFKKYFLSCKAKLISGGHHISEKAIVNDLIPLIESIRKSGF